MLTKIRFAFRKIQRIGAAFPDEGLLPLNPDHVGNRGVRFIGQGRKFPHGHLIETIDIAFDQIPSKHRYTIN